MAISSLDNYIAAAKQKIPFTKTASRTSVATVPFSIFDIAGNPTAGTLAVGNTTNGIVPTDTITGYPAINTFGVGNTGYLSAVEFSGSVAARLTLVDCVFSAGAYSYTAGTTTLSSQPSYSSRVPSGTDFIGTEIWIEVSTAFLTGTAWQVQVTYTNQAGTTGRSTVISSAQGNGALTLGKMFQLVLAAGDTGVQKIESVIVTNGGTAMTAGAFNVHVFRRLWQGRVSATNSGDNHDFLRVGLPQIWENSALRLYVTADSTSTGTVDCLLEVVNG